MDRLTLRLEHNFLMEAMVIGIIILGLVILNQCRNIRSDIEWLKARFVSERGNKRINLACEFEKLAPLYFMPLAYIANIIRCASDDLKEEYPSTYKSLAFLELKEMVAFAATNPSYDKPFVPSENLKFAVRRWAVAGYKLTVVGKWERLFTDVFLALLSGKLDVASAKQKLECVNQYILLDIDGKLYSELLEERDSEAEKIVEDNCEEHASLWVAGKWKERLKILQESI